MQAAFFNSQADAQVYKASGRSDPENSPSHLASTIEKLISELSGLFKNGLSSLFSAREGEDDDEIEDTNDVEDEEKDKDKKASRDVGESRLLKKKKKKGPIKKIVKAVKVGILAAVVVIKIFLLIKIFEAALKFKLLLVGSGSLLLQIVKFWMDFREKKNAHNDDGVVYKSPYEGGLSGAEWAGPGSSGGDYHGRSEADTQDTQGYAQNLAYSQYQRK
ncbi:hypothetical protein JTB14_026421 [Gonioctena quinquepunctata]|nr:hypothetical protein JTB14_026421 [Gonioctena quinquepunctata]